MRSALIIVILALTVFAAPVPNDEARDIAVDGRDVARLGDGTTLSSRDADPEALSGVDVQSNERREADTLRFNQRDTLRFNQRDTLRFNQRDTLRFNQRDTLRFNQRDTLRFNQRDTLRFNQRDTLRFNQRDTLRFNQRDTLRFNQRREADPDALPSTGPPSNERREADPEVQGND
ncbi:hypothetical protein BU23DRAFT_549670, partial [Bimuria novae-zelandiae CBS 107.79]